jgi:acetolactate synthase-1/2/3 large subunit
VSFPDTGKIADAYGIKFFRVNTSRELGHVLKEVLAYEGPAICEVMCIRDQEIVPTVASYRKDDGTMVSRPIEDMYPFLDRDEFKREMIVKPLPE